MIQLPLAPACNAVHQVTAEARAALHRPDNGLHSLAGAAAAHVVRGACHIRREANPFRSAKSLNRFCKFKSASFLVRALFEIFKSFLLVLSTPFSGDAAYNLFRTNHWQSAPISPKTTNLPSTNARIFKMLVSASE